MEILNKKFSDIEFDNIEGIVMFGTGGDLQQWIKGITGSLKDENIVNKDISQELLWNSAIQLTTTGGRHDLMLVFNDMNDFNMGKMAIWRLKIGDCSWISDYKTNYAEQHGFVLPRIDYEEE